MNHGLGTFYWNNGCKFKGAFFEDNISGKGKLIFSDANNKAEEKIYEGIWKDKNGKGL